MKRAFITGITGQDGSYLTEYLLDQCYEVHGVIRRASTFGTGDTARDSGAASVGVWGTGSASREFLYVDDAVRAIVTATPRYDDPDPVNIGTGREVTIQSLVEMIAELTGFDGGVIWDTSKPNGQPRHMLDTSRARERFGFGAEVELEGGLRRTNDWSVVNSQPASSWI